MYTYVVFYMKLTIYIMKFTLLLLFYLTLLLTCYIKFYFLTANLLLRTAKCDSL